MKKNRSLFVYEAEQIYAGRVNLPFSKDTYT